MADTLFQQLTTSINEAGAISRGKAPEAHAFQKKPNLALINEMLCLGHSPLVDGTWVPRLTQRWDPATDVRQALDLLHSIGASIAFYTKGGKRRGVNDIGMTRRMWVYYHQRIAVRDRDPFTSLHITFLNGSTSTAPFEPSPKCPEQILAALITDAVEAYAASHAAPTLFIAKGD